MSKFWQKKYISKYTGAEIDAAVAKAGDATKVEANPTLAGTEAALTGLEVGETKYKVEQPINVVANPTLAGTEAALTGLQVGDIKYKAGSQLYRHTLNIQISHDGHYDLYMFFYSTDPTPITLNSLKTYLQDNNYTDIYNPYVLGISRFPKIKKDTGAAASAYVRFEYIKGFVYNQSKVKVSLYSALISLDDGVFAVNDSSGVYPEVEAITDTVISV